MMLEQVLQEKILSEHTQLLNDGKLFPRAKLDGFYQLFRTKFGPEVLSSVDGIALLELMHDLGNRDGLGYWLEFKNDDEFPAIFGSISGGSALKFIVFRRAETGEWATNDGHNAPMTIPEDEAIKIARSNRDQLVNGAQLLKNFPANASLSDYETLQSQMEEVAPDVNRLAWGHKYFSLLYPNLLDDYHSPHFQRFFLTKLLQQNPSPPEGDARYIPAWWFVQIAHELNIPMNHLTTILNRTYGKPYKYWRIGTTDGATNNDLWPDLLAGNYVAIGWSKIGDLSGFEDGKEVEAYLKEEMPKHYPNPANIISRKAREIRRYCNVGSYNGFVSEGDIVIASNGMTVRGIGRVVGSYEFVEGEEFPHRRSVEWLTVGDWSLPQKEGLRTTVHQIKKHIDNLIAIERNILFSEPISVEERKPEAKAPLPRLRGISAQIQSVLERKNQVILYGPPGTGKTFWAVSSAHELAARKSLETTLIDKSDQDTQRIHSQLQNYVQVCTFHPAYGYEDFLEGFRPEVISDQMVFTKKDGIFKQICLKASADPQNDYFLIVDEINRGDIPRIFGELLTILEKNKRGQHIVLPLSNEAFVVPPNVYLIGTMNTADRSIAPVCVKDFETTSGVRLSNILR